MIATLLAAALVAAPFANYQETASYDLEAELLVQAKQVHGQGRVRWTNRGPAPVTRLFWHMYLNAFANDRSAFLRETNGGALRQDKFDKEEWGYIELVSLELRQPDGSKVPLTLQTRFIAPDPSSPDDKTVMMTSLPRAVAPGETIELSMRFVSQLPSIFARTGQAEDFFFVAQWFPKLGVLEANHGDGRNALDANGEPIWNAHPFHGFTEFFADYGHYRVAITAPSDFVVAATGTRVSETQVDSTRLRVVHEQNAVHDFAFVADRRMKRHVRVFNPAEHVDSVRLVEVAAQLGRTPAGIQLSPVEVSVYIQPEHEHVLDRYFDALFIGLRELGLYYGAYPYPVLSLIDGRDSARGAMGMEYPTLIAGGVRWPAPEDGYSPENVTVHELAHQWFYGLVGSNEVEHPWLDEGLTTYATSKIVDEAYGTRMSPWTVGHIPLVSVPRAFPLTRFDIARAGVRVRSGRNVIDQPGHTQQDRSAYSINSYLRPELTLRQFEVELGATKMARALRNYADAWRFRHPRPEALYAALQAQSAEPLQAKLQAAFESPGHIDYGISRLVSRREQTTLGLDFAALRAGKPTFNKEAKDHPNGQWLSEVEIEKHGSVTWPVQVELRFTDGATVTQTWDGKAGFTRLDVSYPHRVESARLYVEKPVLLDVRPMNDSRTTSSTALPGATWGARALIWVQTISQLMAGWL